MRQTNTPPQLDQLANDHRDAFEDALAEMLDSGFGDLEDRLVERPAARTRARREDFGESEERSPTRR